MAPIYRKLGRAQSRRRAWKRYLGYGIFAGAVAGSVLVGFALGWAAVITWEAL